MRLMAGSAAVGIWPSHWLLAFSTFLFFSLALVKRYGELVIMRGVEGQRATARGYELSDGELLAAMGVASGYLAVLVLALYINTDTAQAFYWPIPTHLVSMPAVVLLDQPRLVDRSSWQDAGRSRGLRRERPDQPDPCALDAGGHTGVAMTGCAPNCTSYSSWVVCFEWPTPATTVSGSQDHPGTPAVSANQFHPHQVSRRKRGRRNSGEPESRDQRMVPAPGCVERRRPGSQLSSGERRAATRKGSCSTRSIPTGTCGCRGQESILLRRCLTGDVLDEAKASQRIYAPLCDGRVYLRNAAIGHRTNLEATTEFLREHVWGAEKIIGLGHILLGDMQRETGKMETETESQASTAKATASNQLPLPALIDSKYADRVLTSRNLGIDLESLKRRGMTPGAWYAASETPGVYVSILQPNLIDPAILQSYKTRVNNLDNVEASALCYLIAFDLDRFELGYALGTEHPKVGWSEHMLAQMRDPQSPGPDGIGSIAPLVSTGLVAPMDAPKTVATFTGGFKREHGAFKYGDLALRNHGSHYGFIENGVVFSKLQPGLATIFVLDDGSVEMKTWTDADNSLLPRIRHARQNGVPVIEFDQASQSPDARASGKPLGTGQLVRIGRSEAAHHALGRCDSDQSRQALFDLRGIFGRHAFRDGSHLSGLPLRLRHASGHERSGTYLSGVVSKIGIANVRGSLAERDERTGQVGRG